MRCLGCMYILSSVMFFFSLSAFGRQWGYDINESHLEVEVDQESSAVYSIADQPKILGHFCLRKERPSRKCQKLSNNDLNDYEVKFYYPNIASDITSSVIVNVQNDRHEFEFQAPALSSLDNPQFVVQIFNKGSKVPFYQKSLAKIQVLIEKLLSRETRCPAHSKKYVQRLIDTLRIIEARWIVKLQKESSLVAKRMFPVQVGNLVSRLSGWVNAVKDWQIGVDFSLGSTYEGERSWINVSFTPYLTNDDHWKFEYYFNEVLLKRHELTSDTSALITQKFLTPNLQSGNHEFKIVLSRKKKFLGIFDTWDKEFEKKYNTSSFVDNSEPALIMSSQELYSKRDIENINGSVEDQFGRIDISTHKALLLMESGETKIISPNLTLDGNILVSSIHGDQSGASKINFEVPLVSIPEGMHELKILAEDFAGNKIATNSKQIIFDRTEPFVQVPQLASLTNVPNASLNVTITDKSEVKTKIWINGLEKTSFALNAFSYDFELVEGVNLIQVVSTDKAGNSTTVIMDPIVLDTIAPVLISSNINNGDSVRTLEFQYQGKSNELLSSVKINNTEVNLEQNKTSFKYKIIHMSEGEQQIDLALTDLAGNTQSFVTNYEFILKIIDRNLISIVPSESGPSLSIIGLPGASRPNIEINFSAGFFNTESIVSNTDGSFLVELDFFNKVTIEAYDSELDRREEFDLTFNVDTTFAGVVKDVFDNPLPGVTVTLASSGQSSKTDVRGSFAIPNPALGEQVVIINGSTVPLEVSTTDKKFGSLAINVSLGNRQQNVLERPIYLAPKMTDGTETIVTSSSDAIVESPHAPGLKIVIPAGAATFPDGSKHGSINALEIPSSRSSIEILEEAEPDTVFALEPSGLKFSQRVDLTLPNVNEFPVGTELVILSKNSIDGVWEVDGSATVTSPDKIETKSGQGISHFSEVYAAPFGMDIKNLTDHDRPSIDSFNGAVKSQIKLPSFKALGQDISPSLVYNSNWANPNAIISNVFDLPRKYLQMSASVGGSNIFGSVKAKMTIQSWIVPDSISSQFSIANFTSDKKKFTGMPDKSVVSYQVDLSEVPDGIFPAESSYEIQFKHIILRTLKIKKKRLFKRTKTITKRWREEKLLDAIFPPSLLTNVYHQNKTNSEYGSGWRLGLAKKILNPQQDRLMIEKEDGNIATYSLKNDIETISFENDGISSFSVTGNQLTYVNGERVTKYDLISKTIQESSPVKNYPLNVGMNKAWLKKIKICGFDGDPNCKSEGPTWGCGTSNFPITFNKDLKGVIATQAGAILLDKKGMLSSAILSAEQILAGKRRLISTYEGWGGIFVTPDGGPASTAAFCLSEIGTECNNEIDRNEYTIQIKLNQPSFPSTLQNICDLNSGAEKICKGGNCTFRTMQSSGFLPAVGFFDGDGSAAIFNNPLAMTIGDADTILIADTGNNAIRSYNLRTNFVTTIAGNRSTYDNGDGLPALQSSIYRPRGIARSSDGSIFISTERGLIRKINSNGIIQTIAGKPLSQGGQLIDIADMKETALDAPSGLAFDEENNYLYVADTGHHRILRLDLTTQEARVVAGNNICTAGDTFDGKSALEVSICRPEQIALDSDNNLYILDESNKRIRKVKFQNPSDGVIEFQPSIADNSSLIRKSDGSFELTQRDGRSTLFAESGQEIQTVDRAGRVSSYQYDDSNRLKKAILPTGQSIKINYSGSGLESIEDAAGRITQFDFSGNLLTKVTYPDGSTQEFLYSDKGVLLEEQNRRGTRTKFNLDKWNRLTEIEAPNQTKFKINGAIAATIANDADEDNPQSLESPVRDFENFQDIFTDAQNVSTTFIKDQNGYVQKIITKDNETILVERDAKGRPTKVIKPDMSYYSLNYNDNTGDLLSRYDSVLGTSETYTYNEFGQISSHKTHDGELRSANYSANGLVLNESYPDGRTITKTYNSLGLPSTIIDSKLKAVNLNYDAGGNLIGITDAEGNKTTYERDVAGNIIKKITPKNETTEYRYDDSNRLISVMSANNVLTSYSYSISGDLIGISDANNNQITLSYDEHGQLLKKEFPNGEIYEYAYDSLGNLIRERNPGGLLKTHEYNDSNQLVRSTLPDDTYIFSYNDDNLITSITNTKSSIVYEYVKRKEQFLVSRITSSGEDLLTDVTNYFYNSKNELSGITSKVGNISYSYDNHGKLQTLTNFKSESFNINYDQKDRISKISRPGLDVTYEWDDNNYLKKIGYANADEEIQKFIYQADKNGNRTELSTLQGTSTFQYDSEGQLIAADQPAVSEAFTYDNVHNRTADQSGAFTYDAKKIRLAEDYQFTYVYDSRGNLISKQEKNFSGKVWTYAFNSLNQMESAKVYESSNLLLEVFMTYDVSARRVKKQVVNYQFPSKSYTQKYSYHGKELVGVYDEDEQLLARYTHSPFYTDDVMSVDVTGHGVIRGLAQASGTYNYIKDGLGSITDVADANGNIIQRYSYSAFGKILKVTDSAGNELEEPVVDSQFTYTGREFDKEIGLYYYRARFYDPHSGRFIQKDPYPGRISSPASINSYIYALNNPVNRVDPSGMLSLSGVLQTIAYSAFGFYGVLYDVNTSDNYTAREMAIFNTAIIMAAASMSGGTAATAVGAVGGASGAVVGAIAGGMVGGIGFEIMGLGNFQQGFIAGAIAGASSGYRAGVRNLPSIDGRIAGAHLIGCTIVVAIAVFVAIAMMSSNDLTQEGIKGLDSDPSTEPYDGVDSLLRPEKQEGSYYTPQQQSPSNQGQEACYA